MSAKFKTLKDRNGDQILPRTKTTVVTNADGDNVDELLAEKVDKVTGKGLSTNDYTTAEKTKLAGIATGATAVSESTVSGWGFTKNTGTYSKPAGGIPASDMASAVQTSLGKADTALQEHQSLAAYRTSANQDVIDNGKQPTIDSTHKLDYSLIDNTPTIPTVPTQLSAFSDDATHRLVTDTEKATWNGKQTAISDLETIRSNASSGASKVSCTDATVGGFGYTKNSGTITGITMNGASKGTSGVVDLGTVITAHQNISGKENTSNKATSLSSSSTDTQYPSAKCVYDEFQIEMSAAELETIWNGVS